MKKEIKEYVFTQNLELDAFLHYAAMSNPGSSKEAVDRFYATVQKAGLDLDEGMARGYWIRMQPMEYFNAVMERMVEMLHKPPTEEEIMKLKQPIRLHAGSITDLKDMNLESTPEMLEFVNQIADDAAVNGPLSKPYVQAGAIRIIEKETPIGTVRGIGFHNTKFAEMVKKPSSHSA